MLCLFAFIEGVMDKRSRSSKLYSDLISRCFEKGKAFHCAGAYFDTSSVPRWRIHSYSSGEKSTELCEATKRLM